MTHTQPTLFDALNAGATSAAVAETPDPTVERDPRVGRIRNGRITISHDGEHRTFQIKTQPKTSAFAPGKRIVSLLTGNRNDCDEDYTSFGFVLDGSSRVTVWHKKRTQVASRPTSWQWFGDMLNVLVGGHASIYGKTYDDYEVHEESRCLKCNRVLTTPESIERGIGPKCAGEE